MGRSKVKMELITNDKNRKTTYQNRKKGLIKKAKELSILCDVNCAIIIYPPPDDHSSNHPEIWPENPDMIKKTIASYKDKKNENGKRMYDVNDYLQSRKRKVEDKLVRARETVYPTTWFEDLNGVSIQQLGQFGNGLQGNERILKSSLEQLIKNKRNDQVQPLNPDLGSFHDAPNEEMPFGSRLKNDQPEPSNHNASSDPSEQVHTLDDDITSNVNIWFEDPQNMKMALELELMLENNPLEPSHHCVGSESDPSLDQPFDDDLIIQDFGWFYDLETPFEFQYNHDVGSVDQVQSSLNHDSMISHDFGCLECAPTPSFRPHEPDEMGNRFDYPALEDDEQVYDNSKQCCSMPEELALQEDSHANGDSVEEFVINDDVEVTFSTLGYDDDSKQCCLMQEDSHVNDLDNLLEILTTLG